MALSIAVDAINLVADRRGMGRYVRSVLDRWIGAPGVAVTLLVRTQGQAAVLCEAWPVRVATIAAARRGRFDAIWYPWNGIRFDLRARRVVTIYDAFAFTRPHSNFIARRREQLPILRAARQAEGITSISGWSANEVSRVLGIERNRIRVIPPACSSFWRPTMIAPGKKPYVLFVGGPDARKNAATLFAAFAHAFPTGDVELIVAGTLRAEDEGLLRRTPIAASRVWPDDAELRELYSNALAVAVPSCAEGYGLMVVEAMTCGAPVLAADAAALPEACDGAAVLLPPLDVLAWSQALERVVSDAALRDDLRARSLARAARVDPAAPAREMLAALSFSRS